MNSLKMFKLHPSIELPKMATQGSACFDLQFQIANQTEYSIYLADNRFDRNRLFGNAEGGKRTITIFPNQRVLVPTGLILDIPKGYSVRVHARSSVAGKRGLVLANQQGVIDSDYTDELIVLLRNVSTVHTTIIEGERIAQAELVKNEVYTIEETSSRPGQKTDRVGGFGSTGV